MSTSTYTVLRGDSDVISTGLSRGHAVEAMFKESGYEIEFRPFSDDEPGPGLFYRSLTGGAWKLYDLVPAPKEPRTKEHYYADAMMNWHEQLWVLPDDEAQKFLAEEL